MLGPGESGGNGNPSFRPARRGGVAVAGCAIWSGWMMESTGPGRRPEGVLPTMFSPFRRRAPEPRPPTTALTLGALGVVVGTLAVAGCNDGVSGPGKATVADAAPAPDVAASPEDGGSDGPDVAAPAPDALVPPPALDAAGPAPDGLDLDLGPVVGDAAATPDAAPDVAPFEPPPEPRSVATRLGQPATTAGLANRVTCEVLDPEGVAIAGVPTSFEVRPAEGWRRGAEADEVVGVRAATYSVTCIAPAVGLRDDTPARWDVFPGPPASVVTRVDQDAVEAGTLVSVTCETTDAEGNVLPVQDAAVAIAPASPANVVEGQRITFTRAGRYQVSCALPGIQTVASAAVLVHPAAPASLQAALEPDLPVYAVGRIVTYRAVTTDVYDNRVDDAPLAWTSAPALPEFGEGRYALAAEGRYTLEVCTTGPTASGMPLCAAANILVDAGGPSVGCTAPAPTAMLPLGEPVRLEGEVGDVAGVQTVTVDGVPVAIDAQGRFSVAVDPTWGLNVHDVVATDALGNANSTFCTYFAADRYHPEAQPLADAIQLVLTQGAIDDGPPDRPLQSLTDLLRAVINSPGLVDTIDASLRAQNPIVPNECRARVFGLCVLSAGAEYRGLRIRGPNTLVSNLVDGGLRVRGRISNLELDVQLLGTVSNRGTLFADFLEVDLTFDVGLVDGRPNIAVRAINAVQVGPMDSDFAGFLTGDVLDLIFSAFEGTVRNTVAGALRSYLETQIDGLLTGVLGGLDVSSFNTAISVPSLGGGAPADLQIAFGIDALVASPQQLRLGLETSVSGPTGEAAASAGVPMPPGPVGIPLNPQGTAAVSVSIGLVNQVLHALWRAGTFRIDGDVGGLPEGATLALRVLLPPAAIGTGDADNALRLFLGPATGSIVYPGLFDEPLRIQLAASARAAVVLRNGNEISFGGDGGIVVDRLALAVDGVALSPQTRATLETLFRGIVQSLLDGSLSGALPSLPVPDFALPPDLAAYGIAPGTRLGVRQLTLEGTPAHWIADGVFSE